MSIGHEHRPDDKATHYQQYKSTTPQDIQDFKEALREDARGAADKREDILERIFERGYYENAYGDTIHYDAHYTGDWQNGNSMNDLRLSLKGYRLGVAIRTGHDLNLHRVQSLTEAGDWLRENVMSLKSGR